MEQNKFLTKTKKIILTGGNFILPPILKLPIIKFWNFILQKTHKNLPYQYHPKWHRIKKGDLKGRYFYIDPHDNYWQQEILEGRYDTFFFDFLKKYNLKDKVIFDIGAHIGYHSMYFAKLVGNKGIVYAFEPNIFNIERMKKNLELNKDLNDRIRISKIAVGRTSGKTLFEFSPEIDCGYSCGGFIKGAHTPFEKADYKKVNFKKTIVQMTSLDNIKSDLKIEDIPFVIKIDIEGAEHLVLKGGEKFIKKNRPILLIEIHNLYNILEVFQFLISNKYNIKLLNQSSDYRCFIAAIPQR